MKYIKLTLILLFSWKCYAIDHVYSISGILTTDNSLSSPYLNIGNAFNLSLFYDDLAPANSSLGTVRKEYLVNSAVLSLTQGANVVTLTSNSALNKVVVSRGFTSGSPDGYQFFAYFGSSLGFSQIQVTTNIAGSYGTNYFTTALNLPLTSLQTVDSSKSKFQIAGTLPSSIVQTFGLISSQGDLVAIPEPANFAIYISIISTLLIGISRSRTRRYSE